MKIKSLINTKSILLNAKLKSKSEVIEQLVALIEQSGAVSDAKMVNKLIWDRENQISTGLGDFLAIPHAKGSCIVKTQLAALTIPNGVDYHSLDQKPAKLIFLIVSPENEDNDHLEVLSQLSRILLDKELVQQLINSKTKKAFIELIDQAQKALESKKKDVFNYDQPYLVAVTACPTGIAHTYMAQESLENKAKALNINIKVETNGSGGVKNQLTSKDISKSVGVIIAADTKVEMERFNNKPLLNVPVSKAIKEPETLINQVLEHKAPIYKTTHNTQNTSPIGKESVLHSIYKHLMSGISYMLPFVIGGGILIAIAFLIDSFNSNNIGNAFGSSNSVAKWFKDTGGFAFSFMISMLGGFIAYSIAGRPGIAVGMVGAFMATQSGYTIYNTGSNAGFLGGMIAGFIGGYLVLGLAKAFMWLPKSLDGIKPTLIYPLFGIAGIGLIMFFVVNTPLSYLNHYINVGLKNVVSNQNVGVWFKIGIGMLLAGMMAVDMGGPINKAAYVIGTASIDPAGLNQPWIMAAVMIGGMVPPIVIALSADLFPQKYTKIERESSKVNYLMGLAFITEGAIPFAAKDPLRVIGSSIVGSTIAGAISAGLGVSIPAPHGGIFVFAVAQGWYWYILALVVGVFVGAFMLGALKPIVENVDLKKWKGIPIGKGITFKIKKSSRN